MTREDTVPDRIDGSGGIAPGGAIDGGRTGPMAAGPRNGGDGPYGIGRGDGTTQPAAVPRGCAGPGAAGRPDGSGRGDDGHGGTGK